MNYVCASHTRAVTGGAAAGAWQVAGGRHGSINTASFGKGSPETIRHSFQKHPLKMVSRGVTVAAAVAVVLSVVATVHAEPGLFKGGCRPHVKYVPHYTTLLQKVPIYHTVYREKIVPAPIYKTEYKTLYHTQYHTQYVPKYVTQTNYNTKVEYVPEYTTQYHTQYQPKYVAKTEYVPKYVSKTQYHTEYYTQTQYKTVYNTQYVPEYVTKNDVQYQTRYHTQYVPQYQTVVKTQLNYKTYCPESSYGSY
ncbi:hypothetical protein O3P69_018256 [Scylla paramamosain]|uniref:Uncharacterized protein n=2 Tax=Scylla paramamosain TaxID=85552 RepID=A0AAW0TJF4_SCYPA